MKIYTITYVGKKTGTLLFSSEEELKKTLIELIDEQLEADPELQDNWFGIYGIREADTDLILKIYNKIFPQGESYTIEEHEL